MFCGTRGRTRHVSAIEQLHSAHWTFLPLANQESLQVHPRCCCLFYSYCRMSRTQLYCTLQYCTVL